MNDTELFPRFDDALKELNAFLLGLVKEYEAGRIRSWNHLETRARQYFEPDQIEKMQSQVPGWKKTKAGHCTTPRLVPDKGAIPSSFRTH